MASANIVQLTTDTFASEVTQSPIPVLVDFWAEWCGPCRALAPTLDQLATELAGQIKIAKVNVDENQELAAKFKVRQIPTLLVFVGGTVREQMLGVMPKDTLKQKLSAHI
jgi:thioredoxin 1